MSFLQRRYSYRRRTFFNLVNVPLNLWGLVLSLRPNPHPEILIERGLVSRLDAVGQTRSQRYGQSTLLRHPEFRPLPVTEYPQSVKPVGLSGPGWSCPSSLSVCTLLSSLVTESPETEGTGPDYGDIGPR